MIRILVVLLAFVSAMAYAWLIEPYRLEVTEHKIDAGSTGDRAIRIVQLSDLHMQSVGDRERAVAAEVARIKPDLVVLSGDVIDRADALGVLDTFLGLLGPVMKVAVLGNWEYWSGMDLAALRALYEQKHGARLLINDTAQFRFGDRRLQVIGLDDFTAGRPDAILAPWTPRGSGSFTAGRYDSPLCPIYISRGIGTSILPIRFGARPEIAVFTL